MGYIPEICLSLAFFLFREKKIRDGARQSKGQKKMACPERFQAHKALCIVRAIAVPLGACVTTKSVSIYWDWGETPVRYSKGAGGAGAPSLKRDFCI